jgi:ribosomal protein L37AE/L43A
MTSTTPAYLVAVLFLAVAMVEVTTRAAYSCPTCGSKRADGHSHDCPWRGEP